MSCKCKTPTDVFNNVCGKCLMPLENKKGCNVKEKSADDKLYLRDYYEVTKPNLDTILGLTVLATEMPLGTHKLYTQDFIAHKEKELEQLKKDARALAEVLEKIAHKDLLPGPMTADDLRDWLDVRRYLAQKALKTFNEKYGEKL